VIPLTEINSNEDEPVERPAKMLSLIADSDEEDEGN